MSRNGSGTYTYPYPTFVYNTVIDETKINANQADIASEVTNSIPRDGQAAPTANLPMGGYKFMGMGTGSAATDSLTLGQTQAQDFIWAGTAGGTKNALTLTPAPAITAYAAGQLFRFIAGASDSDSSVTVAISGLTTKAIQENGSALSSSVYIEAGKIYEILYDGTQFQLKKVTSLAPTGVTAGNYGSESTYTTFTVDKYGRISAAASSTIANGSFTTLTATGGTLNNVTIGASTAAAGTFTTLVATSLNGAAIGASTASTGAFTKVKVGGATPIASGDGTAAIYGSTYIGSDGYSLVQQGRSSTATNNFHWVTGVDGQLKLYNGNDGAGSLRVYMTSTGTSWTSSSDESIKDIIEPIYGATQKLEQLRTVIGKFKNEPDGTRRTFLIAQDVQKVFPELVDAPEGGKLGLRYTDFIPVIIAAIKELSEKVDGLTEQKDP